MYAVNTLNEQKARQRMVIYGLLLLSFYALAYIIPLGARDLFVPDEPRYAEVPREMIADGDWTVPHLNGVRYFEKPVLGYWVHAGALLLFGENNFAVRLPSALAVGLSALLIFLLVKKTRWEQQDEHDHYAPIGVALIFLSCFEVFAVGNTAVLDNLFSLLVTACIAFFYWATEEPSGSFREKGWLLLAGLFCGLAFLTKGFLAFAVPILVLVPYLLWQRRYGDILRMSWLPITTSVVVALPWALRIHLKEPDFWNYFFWNEHIRRFAASNAQHHESFLFFLLAAPGLIFPWTFMIPATVAGVRKLWRERPECSGLLKLCLCWAAVPFLFFSFSKGKLLTYILPCFPPFAVLMGLGLLHVLRHNSQNRLFKGGIAANCLVFFLLLIAFVALQFVGFQGDRPYSQSWKVIMIVNGLVFFLLFCFWSYQSKNASAKITFSGMALLFVYFVAHFTLPDQTVEVKCPAPLFQDHGPSIAPDDVVISDEESIQAVCWYLKRSDIYVLGSTGELSYGFGYRDASKRALDPKSTTELIEQNRGRTILVTRVRNYARWRDALPAPLELEQKGSKGYVLMRF